MRVVVTGGAGFVGSNVSVALAERHPDWRLIAFDNLRRRGSELTLPRLAGAGVAFVHGDVRERSDLEALGELDGLIECSAEPSVLAGFGSDLDYLVRSNLFGAYECLELCRRREATLVFLSTSRVYPISGLVQLSLAESETRFELRNEQLLAGVTELGISELFPMAGARTMYGATKLAAELLIAEYVDAFDLRAVVDRCGVIAGPWQMGKVDQGVFTYWLLAHHFGRPLQYIGFGGKQVRDLMHVQDLVNLVELQLTNPRRWQGVVANVGGGLECSLSLLELTDLCVEVTGRTVPIESSADVRTGDVPVYISDCSQLFGITEWRPVATPREILVDTYDWIVANEQSLQRVLDPS